MDLHLPADAPDDLFISEQLDVRPVGRPDYKQEARAIQAMAFGMADDPERVLPRFVDLALQLTGGASAGLSLFEPEPAPGVFRWQFLRGELSPFDGATTPRNYSPCGITLDRNEVVLTLHPERAYSWIADAGVVCPEVLLVPLQNAGAEPFGTLWIVSPTVEFFTRDHAALLHDLARCISPAADMWRMAELLA